MICKTYVALKLHTDRYICNFNNRWIFFGLMPYV